MSLTEAQKRVDQARETNAAALDLSLDGISGTPGHCWTLAYLEVIHVWHAQLVSPNPARRSQLQTRCVLAGIRCVRRSFRLFCLLRLLRLSDML